MTVDYKDIREKLEECDKNLAQIERLLAADKNDFFELYSRIDTAPNDYWGAEKAIAVIDGKWKHAILMRLFKYGAMRYSHLKQELDEYGITDNMLASSLKELVRDKMIVKKTYAEVPVRVEYSVTKKAYEFWRIMLTLSRWYNTYEKRDMEKLLKKTDIQ